MLLRDLVFSSQIRVYTLYIHEYYTTYTRDGHLYSVFSGLWWYSSQFVLSSLVCQMDPVSQYRPIYSERMLTWNVWILFIDVWISYYWSERGYKKSMIFNNSIISIGLNLIDLFNLLFQFNLFNPSKHISHHNRLNTDMGTWLYQHYKNTVISSLWVHGGIIDMRTRWYRRARMVYISISMGTVL